jgi:hypothetical protein
MGEIKRDSRRAQERRVVEASETIDYLGMHSLFRRKPRSEQIPDCFVNSPTETIGNSKVIKLFGFNHMFTQPAVPSEDNSAGLESCIS